MNVGVYTCVYTCAFGKVGIDRRERTMVESRDDWASVNQNGSVVNDTLLNLNPRNIILLYIPSCFFYVNQMPRCVCLNL